MSERVPYRPAKLRNRLRLLAYLDYRADNRGIVQIEIEKAMRALQLGQTTIWRHLCWLHDEGWIDWPPEDRRVRVGGHPNRWLSMAQIMYSKEVAGYPLGDWFRALDRSRRDPVRFGFYTHLWDDASAAAQRDASGRGEYLPYETDPGHRW